MKEQYVGLDVSLKQTSICVVDRDGDVICEGKVGSEPEAIATFIREKTPNAARIGLETGPTSTWLWTDLHQLGLPIICIDARHGQALSRRRDFAFALSTRCYTSRARQYGTSC